MPPTHLFHPALAMVALTFVVWLAMYFQRVGQMKRDRIHPQAVATAAQSSARLTESNRADNFRNLFELPVLFYLALVVAFLAGQGGALVTGLAWAFVALRVLHSLIHCTYNRVMHRFWAYFAGGVALWLLWAVLAWELLS